jgi:hypothetical protein
MMQEYVIEVQKIEQPAPEVTLSLSSTQTDSSTGAPSVLVWSHLIRKRYKHFQELHHQVNLVGVSQQLCK